MGKRYDDQYAAIGFERLGLFRLIRDMFRPAEVLYPGSSIHIAPSFVFKKVVYLDKSEAARAFFADISRVRDFAAGRREYPGRPEISFLDVDYARRRPGVSGDAVIALFADGAAAALADCVRPGGIYVTNAFRRETAALEARADYARIGVITKAAEYRYSPCAAGGPPPRRRTGKDLVRRDRGFEYRDREAYLVFRRAGRRPSHQA